MEISYPFQYCIDPSADEPIMLMLKQIGNACDDAGNITEYGICGEDFCKELLLLDTMGKSRIQLWINSIGGSVIDGYSILGGILKTKTRVDTYNIGVAASTAGWLFEAGKTRDMSDYATWMGHNPYTATGEESQILERMRLSIIKIISERTGMDSNEVEKMLDKETYMDAEECKAIGFCDNITPTSKQNVKRMSTATNILDKHTIALSIVNQFIPTKKVEKMANEIKFPAIVNKLNAARSEEEKLHDASSEQMIVEAIDLIQNRLTVAESNLTIEKKALLAANKAKDDLKKRYDDLEKEMDAIKCEMEAQEEEDRMNKAKEMVNSFAELGKINNDAATIDKWVSRAKNSKEDFEEIKSMLEDLPVNKEAKKIDVVNTITGTVGPKNLATKMHEIASKNKQK